ncbi:P-loop containing nucleoside triphosphate hydrolase protein [Basidiobolus meristosporus CBS 931.73]|uniref:p-loop containing nucleoside triphosphate hydrolase protein n=1 Tax=Basidiobolus meristosporus CBS 931.73 TaxID=1314790 RepID=A0A1Y1YKT3_9FUNG|nr:P-loop containing nucleoside triphosphate hydrolase protein [Basidiobolus meristosporus CBS 931.73]|eukprot:ORX98599.1 P-loop containing nucleoside triphosphate hydrolase protein [Basidiobolus meristosporus CBS 931.73]
MATAFCDSEGWAVFSSKRPMDFTICFQDWYVWHTSPLLVLRSIITLIPSVVLLIILLPRLRYIIGKGHLEGVQTNTVLYAKFLAVFAAFSVQLALLIVIVTRIEGFQTSAVLSTVFYLLSITGAAILDYFEFFNMTHPSDGLILYWLATWLISIFPTRSWTLASPNGLHDIEPLLKLVFTILAFVVFLLENIPKPNRSVLKRPNTDLLIQTNPSPEPASNYFTKVTFFWVLPLLKLGRKKTLKMEDIYSVHPKFLSYPLYLASKAKVDADEAIAFQQIKDTEEKGFAPQVERGKINLIRTVLHAVGYDFMFAVVPRVLYICALYVRPALFSNLIAFVTSYSSAEKLSETRLQEPWVGYGLLITIFTTAVLSSLFDGQYQNICYKSSLKVRSVLITLIYRKALRLSCTNKQEGMGSIVNHMSTDADNLVNLFQLIHLTWSCAVEVIVVLVLLYTQVRLAVFASIVVLIVMMITCAVATPYFSKHQGAMMQSSDKRMKLISELVTFVKSIKLYAWERYFVEKIEKARMEQLNNLRLSYYWFTFVCVLMNSVVPFSTFATLCVYAAITTAYEPLNIQRIFTTITLLNMLQDPVDAIGNSLTVIFTGKVAYNRLKDFLNSEEIDRESVIRNPKKTASELSYEIQNGTFGWYTPENIRVTTAKEDDEQYAEIKEKMYGMIDSKTPLYTPLATTEAEHDSDKMGPVLHDINLRIKRGSLTAVVGRVGEGKSSLVGALLGEMHRYSGSVHAFGSLAYVAQSAWILNDTVRSNILFGKPYDEARYRDTIRACALAPDLKMLVNGDKTVVGEKGINLSGGQKQRISLARAIYADADVYILDDPLSAVDAHIDQHIFDHAFSTILAEKTRILITHGIKHLQKVDQIVVIKRGRISQDGSYDQLIADVEGDLFRMIQESEAVAPAKEESRIPSNESGGSDPDYSEAKPAGPTQSSIDWDDFELDEKNEVDDEAVTQGRVGWGVYKFYFSTMNTFVLLSFVVVALCYLAVQIMTQIWLQRWGNENASAETSKTAPLHSTQYWILTYFAWILCTASILTITIFASMAVMARKASQKLHSDMLWHLIRSPMSFFDVTSSGKIVNRFAHDITAVDISLPLQFFNLLFFLMMAINIFVFCIIASPYFVLIIVPLAYGYYILGEFFLVSNRELKRLDSAVRSPMYAHFGETLEGLATIRAYGDADRFAIQAATFLDRSLQTSYLINSTKRWLQIMLDHMSILVLCLVALLAIVQRGSSNSAFFAVVLSQIGILTIVMGQILNLCCNLETSVVSVERIREYSELEPEARDVIPDSKIDPAWPPHGEISFNKYSARYREGLDLVLKDVNFTVKPGERVGIVGRTGAGKSSVTLALFRLIEAAEGSIIIDGVDISTLGLRDLRSRLTIIPQDPFLLAATVRDNLDPEGRYTDAELWEALDSASLKSYISCLPEGLSTMIENGGENMSLGQRQLMSLARAMLTKRQSHILCLDEATAAIDIETDNAIQRALRREFKGCTVLTIAHRINTIMDSDRILVLDQGHVVEYDRPQVLLKNDQGFFSSLARKSETL